MQRISSAFWLTILGCVWFGIGANQLLQHGIPRMVNEWKTYAHIDSDLEKRDVQFPGWSECVRVIQKQVPLGADLVFFSDEERYSYLSYLLNYEIYPLHHFHWTAYRDGMRPRFVVIYGHSPPALGFDQYRKVYESARVLLLEKR